jgi:hypothetical protein
MVYGLWFTRERSKVRSLVRLAAKTFAAKTDSNIRHAARLAQNAISALAQALGVGAARRRLYVG